MKSKTSRITLSFLGVVTLFCASQALLQGLYVISAKCRLYHFFDTQPYMSVERSRWPTWVAFLAALVVFPITWERLVTRKTLAEIGFSLPIRSIRWLVIAITTTAIFFALLTIGFRIAHLNAPQILTRTNIMALAIQFGIVAFGEEVFYRGIIQRRLTSILGIPAGLMLAAALWAFLGHARAPIAFNFTVRLPAGILLGWLYTKSRSLYPPIITHWLLNIEISAGI